MTDNNDFAEEVVDEVAPVDDTSEGGEQAQEPVASEETQEKEVSYVTVEELNELRAQLADRENEILRRAKQSNADRYKAIQAEVDNAKSLYESMGAKISPEQERMMRQKVEAKMNASDLAQESPSANGQDAGGQGANTGNVSDPKLQALEYGFSKGGVEVAQTDPEAKMIADALRDPSITPFAMADIAKQAAEKKAQRLGKSKSKSRIQQPTGSGGKGVNKDALKYDPKKPASYYFEQAGKG